MIPLKINLEGDGCWPDLQAKPFSSGVIQEVAYLVGGMISGNPSVSLRIQLDDGSIVVAETSAKLFVMAGAAIRGKCLLDGVDV